MSTVNSLRVMNEGASDSGSDEVEVYADPVRGQENDDEEEQRKNDEDIEGGDATLEKKQRNNGGDAGDSTEPRSDKEAREARQDLEKFLAGGHHEDIEVFFSQGYRGV